MSTHLKWIEGSPEKFEVGMLVVIDGRQVLIGDVDYNGDCGDNSGYMVSQVQKWTYLIRDFELNWHFEMMKGKK